jgi:hypothetical protein
MKVNTHGSLRGIACHIGATSVHGWSIGFATAFLLFLLSCSSTSDLSRAEIAKLDPAITRLLSGTGYDEKDYDVGVRSGGIKEYGVIIRANNTDELQSIGITIQSAFGKVITARLTLPELRRILSLSSVWAVENGSRNYPQ